MRKKPKILHWALFLMLVFATLSCEKDLYELNGTEFDKAPKVLKHLNYNDLRKEPKVISKLNKLSKQKLGSQARLVDVSQYGFYVDTDDIIYIEDGNNHSYTFIIYRDSVSNVVENLVLNSTSNGNYEPYLVKYNLTNTDKELYLSGQPIPDMASKSEISKIDDLNTDIFFRGAGNQTEGGVPFPPPPGCCWELVDSTYSVDLGSGTWEQIDYYVLDCDCGGGGGDGNGDNGGNADGNANGDSNTTGNDGGIKGGNSSSIPGGGSGFNTSLLFQSATPCGKLKAKTTEPETKSKLLDLKGKAATQNFESGYVTYANEPKFSQEYQANPSVEGGSMIEFPIDTSRNDQDGFMHCHLDNGTKKNYAVFSLSDLLGFAVLIQNSTVANPILYVTSAKGNFALVIKNKADFINMVVALDNNWDLQESSFKDLFVREDENTINQMKGFLNFFRINIDANVKNQSSNSFDFFKGDANFENWQKISLDEDGGLTNKSC